jgi:AcrR family transcriptional regulator
MASHASSSRRKGASPKRARGLRDARDAMYRAHIVDTAERVFSEKGFESTKMQDVAAAAEISLATLYGAFPSKAELYQAIVAARGDELLGRVALALRELDAEGTTPLGMMLRGMATHLRFFLEHPAFLKMNLLEGHAWYHRASRPSREQEDHWTRGERILKDAFALGEQAGLFVPEDPAAQARAMVALQQTRLANWVLMGMRASHDEVVATTQAEFVRAFCRPAVAGRLLTEDGSRLRPGALTMTFPPGGRP